MNTSINDYYQTEFNAYHQETFPVDPKPFLSPLTDNLPTPAHILDIGCGSGRDLRWLYERGYTGTGLERSHGLAELARQNSGCRIIEDDFTKYDFSTIQADAIIFIGALVHLPHTELKQTMSRCLQALHGKGQVLITLKQGEGCQEDKKGRLFYLWQDKELKTIFDELGLTIIDFSKRISQVREDDIWLGYVLKNK